MYTLAGLGGQGQEDEDEDEDEAKASAAPSIGTLIKTKTAAEQQKLERGEGWRSLQVPEHIKVLTPREEGVGGADGAAGSVVDSCLHGGEVGSSGGE